MRASDGVEFGHFRLRAGVSEDELRAAHSHMVERHLQRQPGWRGQRLVRLDDGTFIDLALAASVEQARLICDQWRGNASCEAFLKLIEQVDMMFGTVL